MKNPFLFPSGKKHCGKKQTVFRMTGLGFLPQNPSTCSRPPWNSQSPPTCSTPPTDLEPPVPPCCVRGHLRIRSHLLVVRFHQMTSNTTPIFLLFRGWLFKEKHHSFFVFENIFSLGGCGGPVRTELLMLRHVGSCRHHLLEQSAHPPAAFNGRDSLACTAPCEIQKKQKPSCEFVLQCTSHDSFLTLVAFQNDTYHQLVERSKSMALSVALARVSWLEHPAPHLLQ